MQPRVGDVEVQRAHRVAPPRRLIAHGVVASRAVALPLEGEQLVGANGVIEVHVVGGMLGEGEQHQAVAAVFCLQVHHMCACALLGLVTHPIDVALAHIVLHLGTRQRVEADGGRGVEGGAAGSGYAEVVGNARVAHHVLGGVEAEGAVVESGGGIANHLVGLGQTLDGQQLGSQREFPLEDVAVVDRIAIHHLDKPGAVQRTAHQLAEALVGMVEVLLGYHVARVDASVVGMPAAIHNAVARRILVAQLRVVAPAIVPTDAWLVAAGIAVARVARVLGVFGLAEEVRLVHVVAWQPLARAAGYHVVATRCASTRKSHNVGALPVGACDVDVDVAYVAMFHVDADIFDVLRCADDGRVGEVGEGNRRAVGAGTIAWYPIGQKHRLGVAKGVLTVGKDDGTPLPVAEAHIQHLVGTQVGGQVDFNNRLPVGHHVQQHGNQQQTLAYTFFEALHIGRQR